MMVDPLVYETAKVLQNTLLSMDPDTFIGDFCLVTVPELTMKKGSQINAGTFVLGKDKVVLEENVVVGYRCVLLTASDTPKGEFMNDASPEEKRVIKQGPITLKKNSFIGTHSTIMPGVTIEEGVVVKGHSYISDDLLHPYHVYQDARALYKRTIKGVEG